MSERASLSLCGRVWIRIWRYGKLVEDRGWQKNLITDSGLNATRDLIGQYALQPTAIGFGTGGGDAESDDVDLEAEVFRVEITRRSRPRLGAVRMQALLLEDDANGNTLREAGLFNSTTLGSGDMYARFTYDDIPKDNTTQVTATWEWELQRGP